MKNVMRFVPFLALSLLSSTILCRDFSAVSIEDVKAFWDRRPCNVRHSQKAIGTRDYFDEVEQRKYFVEPHISSFAEFEKWRGKRVLEIGCGIGTEATNFARHGAILTVIELSQESLELAKKRFEVYGLHADFILGNAEDLDSLLPQEQQFDLIWSFGVIHHSPHPEKILEKCNKFLKDDGEIRMMVYSKISYKLFYLMKETGTWDFGTLDDLISSYSEAQTGCPITYSYTLEGAKRLFSEFDIISITKDHIFPWNIQKYIRYQYEKDDCFKDVSDEFFKELESELGWHMLVKARKKAAELTDTPVLKKIVSDVIPLSNDGKIEIPAHIKHIKLDVGLSYSAPMSQYWLSHENDLFVFGFEPNPASVDSILQGATKRHPSHGTPLETKHIGKNFFLIPCALGLSNTNLIKFLVTKDCGCSSLYQPRDFDIERVIEVPIFSLAAFFDLFPFETHPVIDYIKIDAQGADLDIAKSAGDYLAQRVVYITLEAENSQYENTTNSVQDIENYMKSIGFVRHHSSQTADPTYFNPRFADYVKKNKVSIYQNG